MADYKSLVTTLLVEQKLKGMTNDKTDSSCFNKMLLYTEIKIATVIFPTGGEVSAEQPLHEQQ